MERTFVYGSHQCPVPGVHGPLLRAPTNTPIHTISTRMFLFLGPETEVQGRDQEYPGQTSGSARIRRRVRFWRAYMQWVCPPSARRVRLRLDLVIYLKDGKF